MFAVNQDIGTFRQVFLALVFGLLAAGNAGAVTEPLADYSPAELEELVGPVALYPDDLIAIILPASSYPLQIVEAARYLEAYETNSDLEPDADWDDAVVALLNYPEILELMNEDLDWTWNLGEAVVNQQADVLDAIQDFRGRAVAAGNLKTDEHQVVSAVDDVIEITPIETEVIYIPYYEPERVVVYQRYPVYHYYPRGYPVYYYPYPAYYSFASGFFWGVSTAYTVGWLTDRLHYHHYGYASHPYYGRHYTGHYYAPRATRARHHGNTHARGRVASDKHYYGSTWKPARRHGARPGDRSTATNRQRTVASNFTGSSGRHGQARDPRVRSSDERRSRTRVRYSRDNKSAPARDTRTRSESTRSTERRRPATDTRRNTRVASADRSGKPNASRRNKTTYSRSGSSRTHATRNDRADGTRSAPRTPRRTAERADTRRRTVREARPATSVRVARATPDVNRPPPTTRRTVARAQPRRESRVVQNTSRSAPESRTVESTARGRPAKAAATRVASVGGNFRGGRSGGGGRHRR